MKRIFPVIVVLITLSLLGIIALQVSWFKNLLIVQEERLLFRVDQASRMVAEDLAKYSNSKTFKTPFKDDYGRGVVTGQFTLSQLFTSEEINTKLLKAFESQGLKKVSFEYALVANNSVEMQSRHFYDEMFDTTNNLRRIIPILTGSDMDFLFPNQLFYKPVVDKDSIVYFLHQQ